LNVSDRAIAPDRLAALPRLPRDEGGPVFAEPWQAQAFALAVKLSEQGHYTWKEWAAALSDQLQAAARRGEPDDGSRYYEHWLAALEGLVAAKGLTDPGALVTRKAAWAEAYHHTPHGQPVELLQSRAPEDRWLLAGLAGTFVMYWVLQQASLGSGVEHSLASATSAQGDSALPVGFAASAGLGALFGVRHALEPDHLAAVSTLMTGERSSAKAAWLGAWWGLGHTLTLFAAGALLVVMQADMPAIAARLFEVCVVLLLIGFGVRAIVQGARRVPAGATHTHRPPGTSSSFLPDRWTAARPFFVGAVHGLAGSGALTAIVVTTLPSTMTRLGYLLLFGVGSTAAMAALSGLLGWPLARLGANVWFMRTVSLVVGCISTALGLAWAVPIIVAALATLKRVSPAVAGSVTEAASGFHPLGSHDVDRRRTLEDCQKLACGID
jgi:nitrile hydratase accessory protein